MKYTNPQGVDKPIQSLVFPFAIKTDKDIQILGTGFFIQSGGGFITARHLLFDNDDNSLDESIMAIDFRSPDEYYFRKISHFFFFEEKKDIVLGMLDGPVSKPKHIIVNEKLNIRSTKPNVDEKIVSLGYPLNKVVDEGGELIGKFRLEKHDGVITKHYPDGRDSSGLPYECYETSVQIESGASGGPVFDSNGNIIGVNSRGMTWDEDPISWITPISEVLDIPIPYLDDKSIREMSDTAIFNVI